MCLDCVMVFSRQALMMLWNHYVKVLATPQSVPDHVLTVYHTQLVVMPWKGFFPDMDSIEMMVKVRNFSPLVSYSVEMHASKYGCEMYERRRPSLD